MTKAELILEVQAKAWYIGLVGSGLTIDTDYPAINAKLYRAHVKIEREANVLSQAHIYFYVFDEGEAGEVAYYKDKNPDDQITLPVE